MKPSYKFKWRMGDQYVYHWSGLQTNQEAKIKTEMATAAMEWEAETPMVMETYWRIWSSRRVSK